MAELEELLECLSQGDHRHAALEVHHAYLLLIEQKKLALVSMQSSVAFAQVVDALKAHASTAVCDALF